jgi:hypothetical protein
MSIEFNTTCAVGHQEIPAVLSYEESDPASVSFAFFNAGEENSSPVWRFGRALLKEALEIGESGQGDIRVEVEDVLVNFWLRSPDGNGLACFDLDTIQEFVEMVYDEVAEGEDQYDIPDQIPDEWLV